MPLPPFLLPLAGSLHVDYRGSLEPQEVRIDLALSSPDPDSSAPIAMRTIVDAINAGAAGGSAMPPTAGIAVLLEGPTPSLDPNAWDVGPSYRWRLSVGGVSPGFVRVAVELLAASSLVPAASLSVVGSLGANGSKASLREREVLAWSAELVNHPATWPDLPFGVRRDTAPRGFGLRVAFAGEPGGAAIERLNEVCALWAAVTATYPSLARDGIGGRTPLDRVAISRREYSRFVEEMDFDQTCVASPLLNMLARFHHEVAGIESVELRTP